MISVSGLRAGYSKNDPVIDGIDLEIGSGELLGITGPNGSGKTTLLRCLYGAMAPMSGTVRLDGVDLGSMSPKGIARRVAVVPQETVQGFDFTVEDVVSMGRYPWTGWLWAHANGHSKAVRLALERTGTVNLRDRPMSELSGGERRMVYLARSLAQSADALLLDEPTRGLDIHHALSIMGTLRRLSRDEGLTVVAVLHDLDTALRYCDRALLLKSGRVVSIGGPEEVLTPANIRTAFGVGSTLHRLNGRPHLEVLG